jgi:polyphosphate glucokinase
MMKVLVIDVGGTHVKILATGQKEKRAFDSGPQLTAQKMVTGVKKLAAGWPYDVVSVGFPGPVLHNKPVLEPHNLGPGWVGFDFARAFGKPVRILNDAAMQALGSYRGGRMLFLGLGTGLGTAMVIDGTVEPMELGHMKFKKGRTFEDYVGLRGLKRLGKARWRTEVGEVIERLRGALQPEYIVMGGGNAKRLKQLPKDCELGDNANAFVGGFRLWETPAKGVVAGPVRAARRGAATPAASTAARPRARRRPPS